MQSTSQFHDGIGIAGARVSEHFFGDATSFHPGDHLFDHHAHLGDEAIVGFVVVGEFAAAGFFLGLVDRDPRHRMALKASVAIKFTALGGAHAILVADLLIMLFAFVGITQVLDLAIRQTGHQVVLHAMGFFLPL